MMTPIPSIAGAHDPLHSILIQKKGNCSIFSHVYRGGNTPRSVYSGECGIGWWIPAHQRSSQRRERSCEGIDIDAAESSSTRNIR
jgi:hypothetical protein